MRDKQSDSEDADEIDTRQIELNGDLRTRAKQFEYQESLLSPGSQDLDSDGSPAKPSVQSNYRELETTGGIRVTTIRRETEMHSMSNQTQQI